MNILERLRLSLSVLRDMAVGNGLESAKSLISNLLECGRSVIIVLNTIEDFFNIFFINGLSLFGLEVVTIK